MRKNYLKKMFGDRILFNVYPYNDFHKEIMMFQSTLLLEFGSYYQLFYLNNVEIEYSIEFLLISKKEADVVFEPNRKNMVVNKYLEDIQNHLLVDINYLYVVDGKELVVDNYIDEAKYVHNMIGVRYSFDNGNEMYIYSAEPNEDPDGVAKYKIFRPDSVICVVIFDKKNGKIKPIGNALFPRYYN